MANVYQNLDPHASGYVSGGDYLGYNDYGYEPGPYDSDPPSRADADMWPDDGYYGYEPGPYGDDPEPAVGGGGVVNSSLFSQSNRGGLNAALHRTNNRFDPARAGTPAVASRASGGGTLRRYPTGSSSTSISENIMPSGPVPNLDLPGFDAPEWDEDKISELSRKAAGPYVGGLRRGLNRALVAIRSSEKNPIARAQMYREALEGFGGERGLGGVLAQARRQGRAEYGQQYSYEFSEAVHDINQRNAEATANFNAAMMVYQAKMKKKTSTSKSISYSGGSGGGAINAVTGEPEGGTSLGLTTGAPRRLSGGMAYPGESMANFINQ